MPMAREYGKQPHGLLPPTLAKQPNRRRMSLQALRTFAGSLGSEAGLAKMDGSGLFSSAHGLFSSAFGLMVFFLLLVVFFLLLMVLFLLFEWSPGFLYRVHGSPHTLGFFSCTAIVRITSYLRVAHRHSLDRAIP